MWHLFTNRTGHSVALGRHFFIQVLFRMCISVSAGAALRWPTGPEAHFSLLSLSEWQEAVVLLFPVAHSEVHLWDVSSPSCHDGACSSLIEKKGWGWCRGRNRATAAPNHTNMLSCVALKCHDNSMRGQSSAGILNCISWWIVSALSKQKSDVCLKYLRWLEEQGVKILSPSLSAL